jgi:arylsulfatase A-like enzyme
MPLVLTRRAFAEMAGAAPLALAARNAGFNVLFIAVDDLKPEIGCYGNTKAITPNIDKLAAQGLTFTRAYCQQAVCSPSRTSLLTGRRPDTTRVYDLAQHFRGTIPDAVTLPEHFKKSGYTTAGLGKIFHGGLDDAQSWSIPWWGPAGKGPAWGTAENAARSAKEHEHLRRMKWNKPPQPRPRSARGPSWAAPDVADNELGDGKTAEFAAGALEKLKAGPFFLAVGFAKPHLPFIAPKRYFDLHSKTKFEPADNPFPPKDVPSLAMHNSSELRTYTDIPEQGPIPDAKAVELIRAYYAATTYTDAQIGRVVGALDRLGLRKNTVIILWGDHGWHLGDHGLWNKHTNFESATRAPLIISVPEQKNAGRKSAALTEFVDIYPSLCDLCGLSLPQGLEGTSFKQLLDNPDRAWKKAAFSQYPRQVPGYGRAMGHSMRTDRYRFTEWRIPGKDFRAVELYDHERDPKENVNIAELPENAALVKRFTDQLHADWQAARP